jgi:hypothetical protein
MSLPFAPPSVRREEPQIALFIESATQLKGNPEKVQLLFEEPLTALNVILNLQYTSLPIFV